MHIIQLREGTPLKLPCGKYLAENINAGEFLSREWGLVYQPGTINHKIFDPTKDYNGKRILFVRPGGYGDLLFLTPIFAEIKRRWPLAEIIVACFAHYASVLDNNPDVTATIPYPVSLDAWNECDAHIWLENLIEQNEKARDLHAVDLIAGQMGLELDGKRMWYHLSLEERRIALESFPRIGKPRVGIQMSASAECRTYPFMGKVAISLWREGWEVFIFGAPGEIDINDVHGVTNFTKRNGGATFRESCAALATCDVCVVPDSALCHVAGALDIPTVALYGPFPWKIRTAYAPQTFALQGHGECAPCFHHVRPATGMFPANKPCRLTGQCEVLAAIEPERVVAEVNKRRPK